MAKANRANVPDLGGVVALIYRADWTRLSLAGEVSGRDDPVIQDVRRHLTQSKARRLTTLLVAPGRRFRRDDGAVTIGCDGERVWRSLADPPDGDVGLESNRIPPFAALLCPSWLLTGYDLKVMGRWVACGRDGIRVTGAPRQARNRELSLAAVFVGEETHGATRVDAVIDRELGILLRCEHFFTDGGRGNGRRPDVLEFQQLTVDPVIDAAMFAPPAGSRVGKVRGTGRLPATGVLGMPSDGAFALLKGPAKTAAGLVAGGLGAAVRLSSASRRSQADRDGDRDADRDAEPIPDDDPPAADGDDAPVGDEVLSLLYRSGAEIPRFTATSQVWKDGRAILAGVPESVRKTGLGGVGHLIDGLASRAPSRQTVSRVQMAGWRKYRIEPVRPAGFPHGCDGRRYWQAHEDWVGVGKPRPVPADIADLIDSSWLLGCELSGGDPVRFAGRAALRLSVRGGPAQSKLLMRGLPAVAVVDARTGRLIRLTCYADGRPARRYELREVAAASDDSGYTVPTGLRVTDID